jgi:hypothetical protein
MRVELLLLKFCVWLCAAFLLLPAAAPSTQYKTVLDALRGRKERFTFEDVEIGLKPSVMAFITMNPGYPGRAGALLSTVCMYRHVVRYALWLWLRTPACFVAGQCVLQCSSRGAAPARAENQSPSTCRYSYVC